VKTVWKVVSHQDGAIGTDELLALGLNHNAIEHRVSKGRLHPKWPGVFAVGRPELSQRGLWTAALLTCGPQSALSNGSAMAYFGVGREENGIEVGPIRVTGPALTLIDFAAKHSRDEVEEAINGAEWNKVITASRLRAELAATEGCPASVSCVRFSISARSG
jgi:hypothetical protein